MSIFRWFSDFLDANVRRQGQGSSLATYAHLSRIGGRRLVFKALRREGGRARREEGPFRTNLPPSSLLALSSSPNSLILCDLPHNSGVGGRASARQGAYLFGPLFVVRGSWSVVRGSLFLGPQRRRPFWPLPLAEWLGHGAELLQAATPQRTTASAAKDLSKTRRWQ